MIRLFLYALAALAPAAASAQQQQQPAPNGQQQRQQRPSQHWVHSETQIASLPARTAFPRVAGPISVVGSQDFSNPETGIDSALQYRSADGQVMGTVYVYLPGLAHPGLAAFATEQGVRAHSNTPVRLVRTAAVRAGNVDNAAVRSDYENYRGGPSSAAFIHAGRWMIKIRVSAPDGRRGDVDAAMQALLAGIRFGRQNPA